MPENDNNAVPDEHEDPQVHTPTPDEQQDAEAFEQRMKDELAQIKGENEPHEQEWRNEARERATRIEEMGIVNHPRYVYAGMYAGMFVLAEVVLVPLFGIISSSVDAFFGTATSWLFVGIVATLVGLVMPALITLYYHEYFFEEVGTNELAVMEFWGRVITREGYDPLKAAIYLRPYPFFAINRYPQEKHSHMITGSDEKTIRIPVQGSKYETPPEGSDKTALTDRISHVEFAGRINISPASKDIRDVLLLFDVVPGENPGDKSPLEIAGERLSENAIKKMRDFLCSLKGPQTFYEAIASSPWVGEILEWGILKEACELGVYVESVVPRLEPPTLVKDAIDKAAKEDAEFTSSMKDAKTAAYTRFVVQTGDPNPTPEKLEAFAADKANHIAPNLTAIRNAMVEGVASKDSMKFIDTGGNPFMQILEMAKAAGIGNTAPAEKEEAKKKEDEDDVEENDGIS